VKFRSVTARRGYRLLAATRPTAASLRPWVGAGPAIDVIGTFDLDSVTAVKELSVDAVRADLGVPAERFVIGTLGQLIVRKGLDVLVDAARRLVDEGVDVHILLGGEGDEREALERRAATLGLEGRLTILSPADLGTSHAEHLRLIAALDVLVMPSRDEGLPLTLLEALAMARPAVVTDVGSIGKVFVGGEHLLLVPPDDVAAVVDAVLRLFTDAALRARLVQAATVRVLAEFDPTVAAQRHERVLVDLVRRNTRRRRTRRAG
jgi:glycosyltransferase involved in cell wall biosynthesis